MKGLLKHIISLQIFNGCLAQILLGPFLNALPHIINCGKANFQVTVKKSKDCYLCSIVICCFVYTNFFHVFFFFIYLIKSGWILFEIKWSLKIVLDWIHLSHCYTRLFLFSLWRCFPTLLLEKKFTLWGVIWLKPVI